MATRPIPTVTSAKMREVDRIATEDFGLPLLSMMENAGRGLATLAAHKLPSPPGARVLCLAGKGGNGGGGLAACRHLANWGVKVEALALESPPGSAADVQASVLRHAGIPARSQPDLQAVDVGAFELVLDAVLGYSVRGDPAGPARAFVEAADDARRVLSLDLPSGLDPDTGRAGRPCIRADATLTLALPKRGLLRPEAAPYVGELWLGDLGIPAAVYAKLGLDVPRLFRAGQIVRPL